MLYDPTNPVVQLCARGIEIEHAGDLAQAALVIGEEIAVIYPSLQLNVAHGYELMDEQMLALAHYELAERACVSLPEDGYGRMIRKGVEAGLGRMK
jgi:hypothetical protein